MEPRNRIGEKSVQMRNNVSSFFITEFLEICRVLNEYDDMKEVVIPSKRDKKGTIMTFLGLKRFRKAYIGMVWNSGMTYNIKEALCMKGYFSFITTSLGANLCLLLRCYGIPCFAWASKFFGVPLIANRGLYFLQRWHVETYY